MAILNAKQVAALLDLSPSLVEKLAREKELPAAKLGGKWFFIDKQIEKHIKKLGALNVGTDYA